MNFPASKFGRTFQRLRQKSSSYRRNRLGFETLESRRVLASVISEVHVEPLFGNNEIDQYIELRGTPNTTLPSGSYFVTLEGWGAVPGGPGYIHSSIDLSGLSFGSNGFLVLAQLGNSYKFAQEATTVVSTLPGFSGLPNNRWSDASTQSNRLAFIFGSGTFLLIQAPQKPVPAADADANDDGVFDGDAASWNVIDSVGLLNTTAGVARSYGKITFSEEPNYIVPNSTLLIDTDGGGYVGRIGASIGWSANDWVSGTTRDTDSNTPLQYQFTFGTFGDPRPLVYSGRSLDHLGTYNFDGGARGTVAMDTNGDGVITGADSILPNITVFADRNGNSIRDSISTQVLAGTVPEGSDLTNRYPNATLTVANQNNKNIGFVVRTRISSGITTLSSEGIPWYDSDSRLKVMFYQEADSISIEALGAEVLRDSYGRMEIYNKNDQLLASVQSGPMRSPQRVTLSLNRAQADIKYAIIYTNDAFLNSSPFGPFDNLNYSFPEFQSISNAQGGYAIEELPKGNYVVQAAGGPAGKIPIGAGAYPLTVAQADHLSQADFGFRNNLPPVIQTSSLSIPENPEVGTEVGQVVASDPDSGQTLTYQFMNFAGPFAIDSATGVVTVANAGAWDFETTPPMAVVVKVTDSFDTPAFSTRTITISPLDENEPPVLNIQDLNVPENSPVGTVVGKVVATDPDAGDAGKLSYSIAAGGPLSIFAIDPVDGTLRVISNTLDFETKPTWTVPITVSDQGVPSQSVNGSFIVRVSNVNEPPTSLTFSSVVRPPESSNVASPISVATIRVTDDALGTNTLGVSGPDAAFFSIASGQLRFQSATNLDFETKPSYVVTVTADDTTVGNTPDVVATFTLTITDVNEAPTGVQFTNVETSILESTNISTGVRVAVVQAIDDALGTNSFTLSGTDAAKFVLVGQELRLRSNTPLDFETKPSFQVTVAVDDPSIGTSPDATTTYTIAVGDVNEPPTQIQLEAITSQVFESPTPTIETALANIAVVDDALGLNSIVLSGPDASLFSVVGNQLRLKPGAVFDFETKSAYDVGLRVEDSSLSGSSFPETSFRLTIGNRPEVISLTDVSGSPLTSKVKTARVTWDSIVNMAPDAIRLKKTDIGEVVIPLTFVKSNVNNRTVADLQFSGPFTDATGLLDGTYVLDVEGTKIASGTVGGVSYVSSNINVLTPALPGKLDIVGPSSIQTTVPFGLQFNLTGLTSPPTGNVDYKIDLTGDGTFERTVSGPLSFALSNLAFTAPGSFTVVVVAEKNGTVLGKAAKVIDVSPATSVSEDWLSALDTDRDNSVSPLDVLAVINRINSPASNGSIPYSVALDVDRDGSITPLDVLSIINYINLDSSSRKDTFTALFMNSTGETRGLTNDLSLSGQIVGSSRNLVIMLDGVAKVDASQYVQPDGKFEIQDTAIAQLFGTVSEGAHMVSIATQAGNEFSIAADKRFYRMKSLLQDFQVTSVLKLGSDTRLQWSSSGSGARYNVYAAPTGSTPVKLGAATAATEARLTLSAGSYDMFIESVDGAGNIKRTGSMTIQVV